MDPFRSKAVSTFYVSATGTTAATATVAATSNRAPSVEYLAASGDAAALVTVTWTAGGTSTTWKKRFSAAFTLTEVFPPGMITADKNTAITAVVSAGTSNCEVQIGGTTRAAL